MATVRGYRNIGSLYLQETRTKDKDSYLRGTLKLPDGRTIRINILPNKMRKHEKHPDYIIYTQEDYESRDED